VAGGMGKLACVPLGFLRKLAKIEELKKYQILVTQNH
jgi:hypothetical protein